MSKVAYQLRRLLDSTALDETKQHQLSGRLSRRYSAIARGDEDVFTRKLEQDGIESAVMIAIDESDSMGDSMPVSGNDRRRKIDIAADAALALSDALKRCPGAKYLVAKFSDRIGCGRPERTFDKYGTVTGVQTVWRVVKKWNEQHGRLVGREATLRSTSGGTPDLAALQDALTLLAQRPEQRKVLLFIGDGQGYSVDSARALQAKFPGVIVIGIGLAALQYEADKFAKVFKHALPITCADDLGGTAMAAIIRAVTK
jgi:cobalamin biosynthesis protein CobT